jgi:hypothetical protein
MIWTKFLLQQISLAFALTWALACFTSSASQLRAQPVTPNPLNYEPPTDGDAPPKTDTTGDRPVCPGADKPLTALTPKYYVGYTVAERPTFWVYVPYASAGQYSAKFMLRNEQQAKIYETTFPLNGTPGIVKFSLPDSTPPLESDKIYRWSFSFNCGQGLGEDSVKWWVKRVALPDPLNSQLKTATPRERIALYAASGLWHEALSELAELRRSKPQDDTIKADWADLLRDPDVGLDAIVPESIAPCCTSIN